MCEHLTRHYQGKVRWAMAGRNQAKLKDLRANLAKINPAVKDTAILLVRSPAFHAVKLYGFSQSSSQMGTPEQISTLACRMTKDQRSAPCLYTGRQPSACLQKGRGRVTFTVTLLLCSSQSGARPPLLQGEVGDQASLNKVASQTKVVIATSGPYAKLGTPVVEACVSSGTHYCDITGEKGSGALCLPPQLAGFQPCSLASARLPLCLCSTLPASHNAVVDNMYSFVFGRQPGCLSSPFHLFQHLALWLRASI